MRGIIMKNKLLYILLLTTTSIFAQWSLPSNNGITSQFAHRPIIVSDGTYLYLDGSYRSSDNGENWEPIPYAIELNHPNALIVFQDKLFSAHNSSGGTILYSTDNGSTWNGVTGAPTGTSTNGFLVLGNNIFAYAAGGIYKSSDGGLNWANKGASGIDVTMTEQNGILLVGSTNNGLFKSTDTGENWTSANAGLNGDFNAGYLWSLGNKVFFNAQSGNVYESTDQGDNWTQTSLPEMPQFGEIAFEPKRISDKVYFRVQAPNLITFDTESYLFVATDSNPQWTNITGNLPISSAKMGKEVAEFNGFIFIGYQFSDNYVYKRDVSSITDVKDNVIGVPEEYKLYQNYPNPFNPSTNIQFSIPNSSFVSLKVFDVLGKEVAILVNQELKTGTYIYNFNASNLSNGVYFYKITAGTFTETKKMILTK